MRRVSKVTAAAVGVTLALTATAACGSKPKDDKKDNGASSAPGGTAQKVDFKACMVTDTGGVDDRSFNASSWAGLQKAKAELGVDVKYITSQTENDYVPNLNSLVNDKCNLIVAVGGLMADATKAAAATHKDQKFAIVDSPSVEPNVQGLEFNTAEAAFLGGYLAAGYSKTGKVATFGALPIPPVTVFMDGFVEGVKYFNTAKGKNVQVIGWDEAKGDGSLAGKFNSPADGERITNDFIAQGADVIMPVAGQTGLGAASVAQKSNGKASIVWVDQDGYESASQYKEVFLSTVTKDIKGQVFNAVKAASANQFSTKATIGTLANNGVGLSPFHDFESKVPAELKTELDKVKADIVSGTIKIQSKNQPK
ncbi:BMP family ABC transporter substrate-binding protein [Streptomyces sp. SID3343]|uniref:BMP family ABC transporter substrate-binding protein n=1 Tax=Streptomyces sp. SID3343 TaxID=2690260 RepID=UPI0013702E5F|nr:BMP family ABC transporter substrate-binding protein [Streptomyces sp. SID3343]